MANNIRNVFISHVHEDDEDLGKLKDLLLQRGCAIRDASITAEKPNEAKDPDYIKTQILAPGIQWAGTFIVYITADTHSSDWVNWEIEYAQKLGKRIVGIWAHGANEENLPSALDKYADAVVGWNSERIIAAISGETTEWMTSHGQLRAPQQIARYSCR